jgi:hypothetical protein
MTTSTRTMLVAVFASIALLALAAVAGAGTTPAAPDQPVAQGPGDGNVAGTCLVGHPDCNDTGFGGPQVVEPTPGMADVRARPYDTAVIADDDVTVTIDFVSGVEPCYVLDHVDVAYAADAVTITLFEGHDPNAGDVACNDIGVFKRVVITLDQTLAGRTLVDGGAA